MNNPRSFVKHRLLAGGLSLGLLALAALSGSTAAADPPKPLVVGTYTVLPISGIQVQAGGHEATVYFSTAEPTTVTVDHKPATAMAIAGQPGRSLESTASEASTSNT